jgi:hypothetical protein
MRGADSHAEKMVASEPSSKLSFTDKRWLSAKAAPDASGTLADILVGSDPINRQAKSTTWLASLKRRPPPS